MNDHEMTMLCAAALGLDFSNEDSHGNAGQHVFYYNKYGVLTEFDPLCNDAQAMALVRHLKLAVAYELGHWEAWNHLDNSHPSHIVGGDEDLNRAIVECVAKMQLARFGTHTAVDG